MACQLTADFSAQPEGVSNIESFKPALAWNKNHKQFAVGPDAVGWRVYYKGGTRAQAAPIFTPSGPLHIPIDASFTDLARAGGEAGWYQLRATDADCQEIAHLEPAIVEVVDSRSYGEEAPGASTEVLTQMMAQMAQVVDKLMTLVQQQTAASTTMVQALAGSLTQNSRDSLDGFASVQRSTAELLKAGAEGYNVAAGVRLPPQLPSPPEPAPAPQGKGLVDFLATPAGTVVAKAITEAVQKVAE